MLHTIQLYKFFGGSNMSDLAATNCNTGCSCATDNGCSWIIIILLLLSCCGNGSSILGGCGTGSDCSCIIIILLILCSCGGGGSFF